MNLKLVIFDFDGTLYDSMGIWDNVGEEYLRSLGKEPKPGFRETVRAMSLYQSALYAQKEYGITLSVKEVISGIHRIIEHFYIDEVLPKPGIEAFLKELKQKGVTLCIATATDRYLIEAALKRCSMTEYFDGLFTVSEVKHGKDEPDIFRTAMDHFHADRTNTVIFEDALHAAETAKKDGFAVIGVFDESEARQAELRSLTDAYIRDFQDPGEFWKLVSAQ